MTWCVCVCVRVYDSYDVYMIASCSVSCLSPHVAQLECSSSNFDAMFPRV